MKRARKAAPPPAAPKPRVGRRVLVVAVTLGALGGAVYGLWRLGEAARREIRSRDRYEIRFADVRCDVPPGTDRDTFLAEVRYAANAPPTLQLLDPDLAPKLTAAFAAHPWVATVDGVTVEPPDAVTVKLTFRTPALIVSNRAVDAKGVLLPAGAQTRGYPELIGPAPPGADAPAGKPWPDDAVVRAAAVAAEYKPKTVERTPQGWELVMPDGKKLLVGR